MIFKIYETKEGSGLIADIEDDFAYEAYNNLVDVISGFYGKRKAVLEGKQYNKQVFLPVVYENTQYGRVKIKYLGSFPKYGLGRHWTEQRFVVEFKFADAKKSLGEQDKFLQWFKRQA